MKVERKKLNGFSQAFDIIGFFVAGLMMHNQQAHPPIFLFHVSADLDPPGGRFSFFSPPSRLLSLVILSFQKSILIQQLMGVRGEGIAICFVFRLQGVWG